MSRLPTMLMPIYTMILQLEKLLLQFCTSSTKHQLMHTPKGNLQFKLQHMDLNLLLQGQQLTRSLTFAQPCNTLEFPSETRAICLGTTDQLLPALPFPTPPSPKDAIWHPFIESGKQLQLNTSHSIGKMVKATLLTSSANIGSLQLCGPYSSLSYSGMANLPPSCRGVTEFRQPIQVLSYLGMPGILVQLGHIQCT